MPSFASGLAAGLSPGINFYGQRFAEDRAEKRFDTRLAEQRNYTVMQGLISEAEKVGIPSSDIAEMVRFGDTSAFRSVLEEAKADFNAGSSPSPTAPTKQQSESSSFLYGQSARDKKFSEDAYYQGVREDGVIRAEKRAEDLFQTHLVAQQKHQDLTLKLAEEKSAAERKRLENRFDASVLDQRKYAVMSGLAEEARKSGMDPQAVGDLLEINDPSLFRSKVSESTQDYNAGSSHTPTVPTQDQSKNPSFTLGQSARNELLAIDARKESHQKDILNYGDQLRKQAGYEERLATLQGEIYSIANIPSELKDQLFSPDRAVRDAAFETISKHTTARVVLDPVTNQQRQIREYVNTPKPKPVAALAAEQERDMLIKVPIMGLTKDMDDRLNSTDPKIWGEAVKEIKANISLAPFEDPSVGTVMRYKWTPGKSNFQSQPKNELKYPR